MPGLHSPASSARIFVGRDDELATLATHLDDARDGRGSLVTIVGEPGIGKTRTVEELLARAALPDDRVLWGRCPEHEGAPAYWPWVQVLRRYVERAEPEPLRSALGPAAADVARIVPALRERLPEVVPSAGADHEQSRFQLFDGIATFFRRVSERDPLVLVLDDLHWADEGSMMLLGFVAPEIRRSRLLIVATYREVEMRRMARGLGDIARVGQRITLTGFGAAEVDDFLRRAADLTPQTAVVDELLRVTDGNPFFLDEMVRMLRLEGTLEDEHLDAVATKLPDEVREVIRRHLRPLTDDDRRLLAIAAVLGREFDVATLQVAAELSADRVLERLESAHAAGLVDEIAGSVGRYRFVHVLIRETLYGDLTAARRAELHRRAALALEALHRDAHDPPLPELARHFFHAAAVGEAEKAVDYSRRAGMQALALLGYEDAIRHFERGLEALALRPSDDEERLKLLLSLGDAAWRAGDLDTARAAFDRALRSARSLDAASMFARAALGVGRLSSETGTPDQNLIALLREALRRLGDGDHPLTAAVMARLAMALYFTRAEDERAELSAKAVAMARRLGDPTTIVIALINHHFMLWGPGDVGARLAITEEGIALAEHVADPQLGFELQRWRLLDLLEQGDLTDMDRELDVYTRRAEDVRLPTYRWHARLTRVMRVLLAGHFGEGGWLATELMAMKPDGYASPRGQCYMIQTFVIGREHRRLAELDAPFKALARHYPAMPIWRCGLAAVRAEQGLDAWVRTLIAPLAAEDFATLPRDGNYIPALTLLAELAHHLGETRWAEKLYPLLLPFADRVVIVGPSAACYGSAARYCGILAETLGRYDDAERHYEDAVAMNTRIASPPYVAYTRHDHARMLFARGDTDRALRLLDAARKTADDLEMPRLRALAQKLGRHHGARPEAPAAARATALLRRDGDEWVVAYGLDSFRCKDMKGFGYLAALLRQPGRELHALDLGGGAAVGGAPAASGRAIAEDGLTTRDLGDAGEVLDAEARAAYKRRLEDLRDELEEAQGFGDEDRAGRAEAEIDVLTKELSRAVGLGGRSRRAGSAAERARLNVTRSISSAIKKIAGGSPALGEHLAAAVRTGLFCVYSPDPRLPISWDLGA